MREHYRKHKGRGHFPKLLTIAITFGQWIIMALAAYILLLSIQAFILNPIVLIGSFYAEYKLYLFLDKRIKEYRINYTSKQFNKLIDKQNEMYYHPMGLKLATHGNGRWLEYSFKNGTSKFEEQIAKRRERLYLNRDMPIEKEQY